MTDQLLTKFTTDQHQLLTKFKCAQIAYKVYDLPIAYDCLIVIGNLNMSNKKFYKLNKMFSKKLNFSNF